MALTQVSGDLIARQTVTNDNIASVVQESFGIRNRIINGNFDIWQRGTSFIDIPNLVYTVDRWIYQGTPRANGGQIDISRQEFTLGQTEVPDNPQYFVRVEQSVAATGSTNSSFRQRIEYVESLAGQQVTVSFYVKANATHNITPTFVQNFGTGGTPSPVTLTGTGGPVTLTTSWQKVTRTVTLPSVAGKTKGTNGNDFLMFILTLPDNVINAVDIAQVQVEKGTVATPFDRRPYGMELALCQRYYYRMVSDTSFGTFGSSYNGSTTGGQAFMNFPVVMRSSPTALEQTGTASNYAVVHQQTSTVCSAVPTFSRTNKYGAVVTFTVASGLVTGHGSQFTSANDVPTAFLGWSAEL